MAKEFTDSLPQKTYSENNRFDPDIRTTVKMNKIVEEGDMTDDKTNKGTKSDEYDHSIFIVINKYRPYFQKLMGGNYADSEDLVQNIYLKFIQRSKIDPNWWNQVENNAAFILTVARNMAFDLRKRIRVNHVSIDEEDIGLLNNLSDNGHNAFQIEQELDYEHFRLQMKNMLIKEFSEYEQKLIQLKMFEGCKPSHIAEILTNEYPEILEKEYTGMLRENDSQNIQRITKFIQTDCNIAEAKFRQRLKRRLKSLS